MQHLFNTEHLSRIGFTGFEPILAMDHGCPTVPPAAGIYAVVRNETTYPVFLDRSVGGHFKGEDPTVSQETLSSRWCPAVATLYIGRATNLRRRFGLLARYGRGEPVAHRGGRSLWQLAEPHRLQVAWRLEDDPVLAERQLLEEFEETYGQLPFANLVHGQRPIPLAVA